MVLDSPRASNTLSEVLNRRSPTAFDRCSVVPLGNLNAPVELIVIFSVGASVIFPLLVPNLSAFTNTFSNRTSPTPLARSSKFEFELVVVITLSKICMSVLLSSASRANVLSIVKLPVTKLRADKFCATRRLSLIRTSPVPLALNTKSSFRLVVEIKLSTISMSTPRFLMIFSRVSLLTGPRINNSATGIYTSGGIAAITSDRTITVTANPGTATDNPTIATNKSPFAHRKMKDNKGLKVRVAEILNQSIEIERILSRSKEL
jgi:hypothetical protein